MPRRRANVCLNPCCRLLLLLLPLLLLSPLLLLLLLPLWLVVLVLVLPAASCAVLKGRLPWGVGGPPLNQLAAAVELLELPARLCHCCCCC